MPTIKSVLKIVGSLWFATALLLILMVAMGSATIYETKHGLDETRAMFYLAPWFKSLLALFALNVLAALLAKFPWSLKQTPFVFAHIGLIVILIGALVTDMKGLNGNLALQQGQSLDHFMSDIDIVRIYPKGSTKGASVVIEDAIDRKISEVNLEAMPPASLDDVSIRVLRYFPDFVMENTMTNDNPQPNPMLEVTLGTADHSHPAWIPAGGSKVIGPVFATFKTVADEAEWKTLLDEKPSTEDSGGSKLIVTISDITTPLTLSQCLRKDVLIGQTGYTINALRYLPHAVIGEDKSVHNASNEPVNPAVEYVLGKDGKQVRRLAFAKFPDFVSLLEGEGMDDVKVVFQEAREIKEQRPPVEIFAGPNNQFGVRFTSNNGQTPLQAVKLNQSIPTPFSKESLTLKQFLTNAQQKQVGKVPNPLRKNRQPAVEVEITTPDSTKKEFLRKNYGLPVIGKKGEYQVAYEEKPNSLGFNVKLDSFKVSYYPGGMRPRTFESQVTFESPETGTTESQLIAMNKPGKYGGYTFYQSSYFGEPGKQGSVLSVAKDPGLPIVYLGYFLTVFGMLLQLINRSKQGGEKMWSFVRKITGQKSATILVFFLMVSAAVAAPGKVDPKSIDTLRTITVQYKGRYMPLDTLSRDVVRTVTGSENYKEYDPVALVLTWIFEAGKWEKERVFSISNDEFRSLLKLPEKQTTFSFNELLSHQPLRDLATQAAQKQERGEKLDALEMKVQDLEGQLVTFRNTLYAEEISIIPNSNDSLAKWQTINWLTRTNHPDYQDVKKAWFALGGAFMGEDAVVLRQASQALAMQLDALPAKFRPHTSSISQEIHYNQFAPWTKAWILMLIGTVLALASVFLKRKGVDLATTIGMVLGFGVLTYGIYLRWMIAGRIPASNMFESLLFLSWGAALFTILGPFIFKNRIVTLTGAFIAGLSLMLADVLPIDASIKPVAPVLLDTFWMALHVPVIMISYSVLAIAMLVAHVQVIGMGLFGKRWKFEEATDIFLYWYMFAGSLLLIIGILTGSLWAAASWGRYWGWDPKEVWSLVAFLGYMAIMHLKILKKKKTPMALQVICWLLGVATIIQCIRFLEVTPWKIVSFVAITVVAVYFLYAESRFATAAKNILAFWLIIMTYVGVNYILGTGLHSYGFGAGAAARGMIMTGTADLVILLVCLLAYYLRCYLRPDTVTAEDALPAEA